MDKQSRLTISMSKSIIEINQDEELAKGISDMTLGELVSSLCMALDRCPELQDMGVLEFIESDKSLDDYINDSD